MTEDTLTEPQDGDIQTSPDTDVDTLDTDTDTGDDTTSADDGMKLSKEALQQISSMTGRLVKKHIDEEVKPYLTQVHTPQQADDSDGDPIKKLNNELQEMIFEGRVTEAFQKISHLTEQAKTNLKQQQRVEIKKAITARSEDPYYKDTYQDVENIANELVEQGVPPEHAVSQAFDRATNKHLQNLITGANKGDESLETLKSGKRTNRKKTLTLPPNYKAACEKGIQDGVFKDEADFIANLDHRARAELESQ